MSQRNTQKKALVTCQSAHFDLIKRNIRWHMEHLHNSFSAVSSHALKFLKTIEFKYMYYLSISQKQPQFNPLDERKIEIAIIALINKNSQVTRVEDEEPIAFQTNVENVLEGMPGDANLSSSDSSDDDSEQVDNSDSDQDDNSDSDSN